MIKHIKKGTMSIESIFAKIAASFIGGAILEQLVEIRPFIIFVLLLVLCDTITGITAARKRGEKLNSKGLRRTVSKFTMYSIAIVLSQGMEHVFNVPQVVYVVSFYISATEFISNLENIGSYTGIDIAARVRELIQSRLKA